MARQARIAGVQRFANRPAIAEISTAIDRRSDHRRDITQRQMLFVTEVLQRRPVLRLNNADQRGKQNQPL